VAEELTLESQIRTDICSRAVRDLRKASRVPGVLYGHGKETVHLSFDNQAITDVFRIRGGLIKLSLGENNAEETVVVKDFQVDVLKDHVLHVDLIRVSLDEKITVSVPVKIKGDALGVKAGGQIERHMMELELICTVTSVPEVIEVRVDGLEIGDMIYTQDIELPENTEFSKDVNLPVVSVAAPVEEEETSADEGVTSAEPELIGRSDKEEQEEED